MANKSTLSDYLAALGVDINNMQEFLNKLSQMLVTNSDTVAINQKLQDGTTKTFNVPSFAYLTGRVDAIDAKFNSLLTGNAQQVGVADENGQVRRFELQDISKLVQDLDAVAGQTLTTPVNFNYKTNWFFESFLNPLIYIDFPVDNLVTDDIDKFEVKRVIMTSQAIEDTDYFDTNYRGQNNISYSALTADLTARGINHFEDINEISLPPSQNKYFGSFSILSILTDTQAEIIGGETLTFTVNRYVLNTLRYSEKSAQGQNKLIQRTLKVGDYLISADNSEYQVTAVNVANKSIIVKRVFGIGSLSVGANQLTIKPELRVKNTLSVNVGYNERQVIFLKPVSTRLRLSTESFSLGVGFYTNQLTISLGNGQSMTFDKFYSQFVSDFGLLFLAYAKEKNLPSSLGDIPNAPVLESSAFKVIQADSHIKEADSIEQVKRAVAEVEQVKAQTREVDKQINDKNAELNTGTALGEAERIKLEKELITLSGKRKALTTQQSSKVIDITSAMRAAPNLMSAPKYTIKGFWQIPDPKITPHGPQNVVQFKVSYRVLSKTGTTEQVEQIKFTDPSGNEVVGAFSPWKESLSKPRGKKLNQTTGFYEWAPEAVADPNSVNMNQVEIPIEKGQVVEIRVKSLSEAGYPTNPVESDWSNSILVEFPEELQNAADISIIAQQNFAEEVRLNFQDELNSKGLDLHLGTAFTSRDKYFAHKSEDIASGFFSSDGSIVDLYTKLKSISDTLAAVQTAIASGEGQLKVAIVDQDGTQVEVTNGQTVKLFAGYYKDEIKNASGANSQYEHGKIITKQYYIQLENISQTPLDLVSLMVGGSFEKALTSDSSYTDLYNSSLRYDRAPIVVADPTPGKVGSFQQSEGLQSSQSKGQIVYARAKTINLAEALYFADSIEPTGAAVDTLSNYGGPTRYNHNGYTVLSFAYGKSTTLPYSHGHYVPYNPKLSSLTVNINGKGYTLQSSQRVWNGDLDTNNAPRPGGILSEFCISIDHPDIKKNGRYNQAWASSLYYPDPIESANQPDVNRLGGYQIEAATVQRLPFSQAAHFETTQSEVINTLGAKYFQQAAYRLPDEFQKDTEEGSGSYVKGAENYPIKCSFDINDKYLIGKYTCGAYMFISPPNYQAIGSTSVSPTGAKRVVPVGSTNAVKIPLIFQYRCSDYLKYIGGFRADAPSGLKNVGYTKKMGFDIGLKSSTFSFDVEISAQYDKETALTTPSSGVTNNSQAA